MNKAPLAALMALAALTSACQNTGAAPPELATVEPEASAPSPPAFVEAACGGCHAVQPPFLSPNPASPSFEAIANRDGLTEETLAGWLSDAHNYPEMMDFDLEPHHVDQIADYMLTLQSDDYKPLPD